jgi:hypothetical protein
MAARPLAGDRMGACETRSDKPRARGQPTSTEPTTPASSPPMIAPPLVGVQLVRPRLRRQRLRLRALQLDPSHATAEKHGRLRGGQHTNSQPPPTPATTRQESIPRAHLTRPALMGAVLLVARGGVEPPTFRFSVGRFYQREIQSAVRAVLLDLVPPMCPRTSLNNPQRPPPVRASRAGARSRRGIPRSG